MSADTRPSSTDEGGVITNADDPNSLPTLDPSVPFIDLPLRRDDGHFQNKCRACGWDGDLQHLVFNYSKKPRREELETGALSCPSCKAKLLILEYITRYDGFNPEAEDKIYGSVEVDDEGIIGQSWMRSSRQNSIYDIFTPSEHPLADLSDIFKIPIRRTTSDSIEQSMTWARKRITNCLRLHKPCVEQAKSSVTPTRLIDVDPGWKEKDVRLVESRTIPPGTTHEYATLSYCWGRHTPACMTTPQTKEQNLRCIPWSSLPKTFRDAVIFTRGLGLKYLWIDSICIIQGDNNDWREEAGKMFDVYRGSKVTLGAVFGNDSKAGLRSKTIKQQIHHVFNLRIEEYEWPIFIRQHHYLWDYAPNWMFYIKELTRIPLLTRGWIYQERILSPRLVLFTEGEIVYQCASALECECGSSTDAWKSNLELYCDKSRILRATQHATANKTKENFHDPGNNEDGTKHTREIKNIWRATVAEDYSGLSVTKPTDRLVALSAVAKKFQRVRSGSEYLAGLWSDSLIDDLVWFPRIVCERPFKLPTWAWASISGEIWYDQSHSKVQHIADVVEANCVYAKENPFGILESSKLVLRSRMLSCSLREDGCVQAGPGDESWESICCLDEEQTVAQGLELQEVYLLQMLKQEYADSSRVLCLILRLEDHISKRFSRLGMTWYGNESTDGIDHPNILLHRAFEKRLRRAFEERGEVVECEII